MDNFDENRVVVTSLRESMCVVNIEIYKLAYTISLNSELKKKKKGKKVNNALDRFGFVVM